MRTGIIHPARAQSGQKVLGILEPGRCLLLPTELELLVLGSSDSDPVTSSASLDLQHPTVDHRSTPSACMTSGADS